MTRWLIAFVAAASACGPSPPPPAAPELGNTRPAPAVTAPQKGSSGTGTIRGALAVAGETLTGATVVVAAPRATRSWTAISDDGRYEIFDITPGDDYIVSVYYSDWQFQFKSVSVCADGFTTVDLKAGRAGVAGEILAYAQPITCD